jgi:hypothetical protein
VGWWVDLGVIRLIIMLLFIGLAWGQVDNPDTVEVDNNQDIIEKNAIFRKHNLSIGMFDDKTGMSLIGYTYNFQQKEMNEFFIGGGTIIKAFTGTFGWKHYFKKSKLSLYSVLSGQGIIILGVPGFMQTASFGAEYNISRNTQIKMGAWAGVLLSTGEYPVFPFVTLNRRF